MADEPTVTAPQTAPNTEDKPKNVEQDQNVWADIVNNKFRSPEEVAKAYKELEHKFGEQSAEVSQAREFMQTVYPLLQEIQNDPTLFKLLDERLKAKESQTTTQTNEPSANLPKSDQGDIRSVTSDLLLARFEEKHGIDKLEPDERRKLRQEIGNQIVELTGTTLKDVDLRKLGAILENAYVLHKSKSADSGETEAEDRASIASVPSKAGKAETVLTPEEAEVAQKMGLTREQYLEGKKQAGKVK